VTARSTRPDVARESRFDVVVTLGTDHHPFARLVTWVDRWAGDHHERRCLIQHGTAPAPRHAEGHVVLDPADIAKVMAGVRLAVGHAGPGTVLDARRAGRLPVVVPRLARHGEVVDDHQVRFGRWMHEQGQVICAESEPDLRLHLDAAMADEAPYTLTDRSDRPPAAVLLFGDLVDGILAR